MRNTLVIIGTIILCIAAIYGGLLANRWFNYTFGYQSKVEETVRELVKSECLK